MSDQKVVCVTGGGGYIGSWLVKLLLQRGYAVRATVRDPDDPKKTSHLMALEGAAERLRFVKADLLEEGSFSAAVEGCVCVFHTASPFFHKVADPQAELVAPAVNGTLNVLRSCAACPSVKRVVYTSSMAAVTLNGKPVSPEVVIDETWFSDPELCRQNKAWYMLSKTLAEEEAWKYATEHGIDMVVLNPGLVFGPLLQPTLNTSAESILDLINGAEKYLNITHRYVDVRDVAMSHVLAMEKPTASGRYCLVGTVIHSSEILKVLERLYPGIQLPKETNDGKPPTPTYQVSTKRAESLGLNFTPFEISLKDTVTSLCDKSFVNQIF